MIQDDFKIAVKETKLFKDKQLFSQNILIKYRIPALYDYYLQATKYGVEYLHGNPNILRSEYRLLEEILLYSQNDIKI